MERKRTLSRDRAQFPWQAANPQMRAAALGLHGDPGVALGLGQHKNERRAGLLDEVKGGT